MEEVDAWPHDKSPNRPLANNAFKIIRPRLLEHPFRKEIHHSQPGGLKFQKDNTHEKSIPLCDHHDSVFELQRQP